MLRKAALAAVLVAVLSAAAHSPAGALPKGPKVQGVQLASESPGVLAITWDAPSQAPRDYRLVWAKVGEGFSSWKSSVGNAFPTTESWTLSGLEGGVEYKVRVRARYDRTALRPGPWSDLATLVVMAEAPDPPVAEDQQETEDQQEQSEGEAGSDQEADQDSVPEPEGQDLAGSVSSTGRVAVGGSVTGNVERVFDVDWYGVELEQGNNYVFELRGRSSGGGTLVDPVLVGLRAADGTVIAGTWTSDGGQGEDARLAYAATSGGTHWVAVSGGEVAAIGIGTYTLSAMPQETPPAPTRLRVVDPQDRSAATMKWGAVRYSAVTGYQIERSVDGGDFEVLVPDTGSTRTRYTDNSPHNDGPSAYRVAAINAIGAGEPSEAAGRAAPPARSEAAPTDSNTDLPPPDAVFVDEPLPETASQGIAAFSRDGSRDVEMSQTQGSGSNGIWSDGTTMWASMWASERWDWTGDHRVYAYDLATGARKADRDIDSLVGAGNHHPNDMWSDGTTIWVSDVLDQRIYAYDLATGARRRSRDFDVDTMRDAGIRHPAGLWSDGATMWVSDRQDHKLYAFDLYSRARRPGLDFNGLGSHGNQSPSAMWSDGATMWVSDSADAKLYAYDLSSRARKPDLDFDTLAAAGNETPRGIWSDGTTMWVTDWADRKLYAYKMPDNALLASLELSGAAIGHFTPAQVDYTARVPNTTAATTVTATPASTGATVTVSPTDAADDSEGHQVNLSTGANTITITVTNGGDTTTYTVVVTKIDTATLSDDASLSALSLSGVGLGAFSSTTDSYSAGVANTVHTTTVSATATDSHAEVTIHPADADTETMGHQIDLAEGANTVSVTARSSDGTKRQTYTIVINKATMAAFGWYSPRDIQLRIGRGPTATGIWSDGTTIWVSDFSARKIYAYDLDTGDREADLDIDSLQTAGNKSPQGIWSDGTTIWVVDFWGRRIYAYDLDTGDRKADLDIDGLQTAGNESPRELWSDGTTIWVSDNVDHKIYAYDLDTGDREADLDIDDLDDAGNPALHPHAVPTGLWSDGTTMWVADWEDNKLYAYDLDTGDRKADLDFDTLGAARNRKPRGIWSDGTIMWVADWADGKLYAYMMPDNALLRSLELSGIDIGHFTPAQVDYTVQVPNATAATTVTATPASTGATVTVSPTDADGADGHQVNLSTGANTITVTVTNGGDTTTYTVTINRASQ